MSKPKTEKLDYTERTKPPASGGNQRWPNGQVQEAGHSSRAKFKKSFPPFKFWKTGRKAVGQARDETAAFLEFYFSKDCQQQHAGLREMQSCISFPIFPSHQRRKMVGGSLASLKPSQPPKAAGQRCPLLVRGSEAFLTICYTITVYAVPCKHLSID